jgi:hypothetical protein
MAKTPYKAEYSTLLAATRRRGHTSHDGVQSEETIEPSKARRKTMRRHTIFLVGWVFASGMSIAHGGDREDALVIVNKAIQAHGGAAALDKARMRSREGQGIVALNGETRIGTEETFQFPDRCRLVLTLGRNRIILVINGNKGWTQAGGTTQAMNEQTLKEKKEELYVWWLMNLTPLLKDEFDLKPLADEKINGEEAAVVKVVHRGYPDVRLFFDKKSGLLVKMSRRTTETGFALNKDYVYSDYKEFDGGKWPTKEVVFMGGTNKVSEIQFKSYKVLSSVEDKLFEKP